jgi:alpha-N-arabinofuranosidase
LAQTSSWNGVRLLEQSHIWLSIWELGHYRRVNHNSSLLIGNSRLTNGFSLALNWVEYCNGDKDTYYANLRRANGHEKPYNVKYWALGNEMWGPWQVEQHSKEDYAKKACQWGKGMVQSLSFGNG